MLNTQKLLYVLPDLAYIAELLPDKKPYTFAIQSFKQINGEFLNEKEFIAENIVKLVNKLEEGEEYFLILPDFLFTNTIVSVKETSDAKIKETLSTETLPSVGLKEETHLIETVVLNQLKGTTRVQLSAIEKSVLSIFKVAIAEKDIKIAGVCPLSWAVKSLISLEPSISVLQMGSHLFTAQQYIGVDQTTTASVDSPENIVETIKTLKGAESSIQTVYLCTNAIVEDKLKDQLSKILPLQQMATKDGDAKIPSYIYQIITASMRTLNVPDFSVPTFKLAKPTSEEKEQYAALITAGPRGAEDEEDETTEAALPKPKVVPESESTTKSETEEKVDESALPNIEDIQEPDAKEVTLPDIETAGDSKAEAAPSDAGVSSVVADTSAGVMAGSVVAATTTITPSVIAAPIADAVITPETDEKALTEDASAETKEETNQTEDDIDTTKTAKTDDLPFTPAESSPPQVVGVDQVDTQTTPAVTDTSITKDADQDIDLSQFTQGGETTAVKTTEKPVIKHKSGVKNMMKMILITTGVFILTVAIGVGVGFAILKYSGSDKQQETPVVEVEEPTATPSPTPEPTAEASSSAEVNKENLKILVVNATTKAGYAGQISTKLKSATFTNVTSGNAKGEYDDGGDFVYLKEPNNVLLKELSEVTDLALTEDDSAKTEDTQGKYDVIIVLAK